MPSNDWSHLIIPLNGFDRERLLAEWQWLIPKEVSPLWLNSFGDWVFVSPDGKIHFLDLLEGSFNCIAASEEAFENLLQIEENRNLWLMADWFEICNERGLFLSKGQCYGWKVAPAIGGKFEFSNIQLFDVCVYESIMGQIHRQVKRLAPDAIVTEFKIGQ